jgi:tellurite resistance protein TerC
MPYMDTFWMWVLLAVFGVTMVLVDLFVAGRPGKPMTFKNSLWWSIVWLVVGIAFTIPVWSWLGKSSGEEYLAGYLIERSLSLDNVFVFAVIFAAFAVPAEARQRALMFGIAGALVLRVIMIFAGLALIDALDWMMYVFGAILVITGVRMATVSDDHEMDIEQNKTLRLLRRFVPITEDYHDKRLLTRVNGKRMATPLLAVFAVIATTDLIFAVDSIPAIFAITTDPYIVVAANVLALAGLRSLYFLLEGMLGEFRFLKPALALLLVVIGIKLLIAEWYHPPTFAALILIVGIVGAGIAASILIPEHPKHHTSGDDEDGGPSDGDDDRAAGATTSHVSSEQ